MFLLPFRPLSLSHPCPAAPVIPYGDDRVHRTAGASSRAAHVYVFDVVIASDTALCPKIGLHPCGTSRADSIHLHRTIPPKKRKLNEKIPETMKSQRSLSKLAALYLGADGEASLS